MPVLLQHLNTRYTLSSMPAFCFPSACYITVCYFSSSFCWNNRQDWWENMYFVHSLFPLFLPALGLGRSERICSFVDVLASLAPLLRLVTRQVQILVRVGLELVWGKTVSRSLLHILSGNFMVWCIQRIQKEIDQQEKEVSKQESIATTFPGLPSPPSRDVANAKVPRVGKNTRGAQCFVLSPFVFLHKSG